MNTNDENHTVDLNSFAELVGLPAELIKKELFSGQNPENEVSLEGLREAMLAYLNSAMLTEAE